MFDVLVCSLRPGQRVGGETTSMICEGKSLVAKRLRCLVANRLRCLVANLPGGQTTVIQCDIGEDYVECDPNPIYISESLTVTRKKLFRSCLKFKKEFKLHAVSTSNGRIYIKEEKKKRRVYIDSEADLAKLRKQISARSRRVARIFRGGCVRQEP